MHLRDGLGDGKRRKKKQRGEGGVKERLSEEKGAERDIQRREANKDTAVSERSGCRLILPAMKNAKRGGLFGSKAGEER